MYTETFVMTKGQPFSYDWVLKQWNFSPIVLENVVADFKLYNKNGDVLYSFGSTGPEPSVSFGRDSGRLFLSIPSTVTEIIDVGQYTGRLFLKFLENNLTYFLDRVLVFVVEASDA